MHNPSEPWLSVSKRVHGQLRNTQLTKTHFYLLYGRINSYTSIYIYTLVFKKVDISNIFGSKSDYRAEISENIVRYDALAPRLEVLRSISCLHANPVP